MTFPFLILSLLISLIGTILVLIFLMPEGKRPKLNKYGKWFNDFLNFKSLMIEKLLHTLYIFSTIFSILFGLFYILDSFSRYGYYTRYGYYSNILLNIFQGFLIMIFLPIIIRISFEAFMLMILLVKNVIQINGKLKNQNDSGESGESGNSDSTDASSQPETPIQNVRSFCPYCGSKTNLDGSCPNCG